MSTPAWYSDREPQGVSAPAGFYPDPQGTPGLERWWNGVDWSEQTRRSAPAVQQAPVVPVINSQAAGALARGHVEDIVNQQMYPRLRGMRVNGRQATPASTVSTGSIFGVVALGFSVLGVIAGAWPIVIFSLIFVGLGAHLIVTGRKAAQEFQQAQQGNRPAEGPLA